MLDCDWSSDVCSSDLIDITKANINIPSGTVPGDQVFAHCRQYEEKIESVGGIDLQILGIGRTGHIGFNEPGSSLASRTRVKTLTGATRADNARFFDSINDVPRHCLTQGLGTILEARELVLLAFGEGKAEAVAGAVEGPVSASLPGSVIQLHPEVLVLVDEAAASRLRYADYYRDAWEHRLDV
jgi:glucosamine-6-phosphate deaminase